MTKENISTERIKLPKGFWSQLIEPVKPKENHIEEREMGEREKKAYENYRLLKIRRKTAFYLRQEDEKKIIRLRRELEYEMRHKEQTPNKQTSSETLLIVNPHSSKKKILSMVNLVQF